MHLFLNAGHLGFKINNHTFPDLVLNTSVSMHFPCQECVWHRDYWDVAGFGVLTWQTMSPVLGAGRDTIIAPIKTDSFDTGSSPKSSSCLGDDRLGCNPPSVCLRQTWESLRQTHVSVVTLDDNFLPVLCKLGASVFMEFVSPAGLADEE